jgi:outer membrane protein assembly factor BamB
MALWQTRSVRGPSGPVATDSTTAYVGGSDHRIVAIDLGTGRTRWTKRLSGPIVGGILRSGKMLYVATDRPGGRLHALETASGNERWSTGTGYVSAPIALVGGRLIVLNRREQILGLDPESGHVAWRRPLPSERVAPQPIDDARVLVSSFDSLYLVQSADGRILLRRRSPGTVVSPWVATGGELVAGTADSLVVAIDPDSLRLRWQVRLDGPLLVSPAARGDTLYCITQLGSLYRVIRSESPAAERLNDGRWAATGSLVLFDTWALVGGSEGGLHAFRLSDGTEEWTASFGRPFELAPIVLGDSGFLALGGRGDLHRIGK